MNDGKTLVTGGTGFVGRAVVEELLAAGRPVRVLVRNPAHPALAGLNQEIYLQDLIIPPTATGLPPYLTNWNSTLIL